MTYKASLDKTAKIITVSVSVLFVVIIIIQGVLFFRYHNWHSWASIVLLILIYAIAYLYSPRFYKVENNAVIVHRPASDIVIQKNDIRQVSLVGMKRLSDATRLFGVGGMFGYFGQFLNREFGSMKWYATQHNDKMILIETTDRKKIVVSPDEPEQFLQQLQTAL